MNVLLERGAMLARANRLMASGASAGVDVNVGGGGGFDDDEEEATAVGVSILLLSSQEAPSLVLRNIAATYRQVPDICSPCGFLEDLTFPISLLHLINPLLLSPDVPSRQAGVVVGFLSQPSDTFMAQFGNPPLPSLIAVYPAPEQDGAQETDGGKEVSMCVCVCVCVCVCTLCARVCVVCVRARTFPPPPL
jgi:hypothetical protein